MLVNEELKTTKAQKAHKGEEETSFRRAPWCSFVGSFNVNHEARKTDKGKKDDYARTRKTCQKCVGVRI
jgi:hypothetical protein